MPQGKYFGPLSATDKAKASAFDNRKFPLHRVDFKVLYSGVIFELIKEKKKIPKKDNFKRWLTKAKAINFDVL